MADYIIETDGLTKHFGKKTALSDFSLRVERGGVNAIVGSNGAGKSTLFRILLGLQSPSSGDAKILDVDCKSLSPEARGKIGYVNEEHTLPGWMLVKEVKAMQKALYPDWDEAIFEDVIGHFDVEDDQKVSSLSRGERAGFNLSMALAQNPEILILDEPTLGLDVVAKRAFLEALMFTMSGDFSSHQSTIIYCSHQMDEIERVADNLIIMEQGKLRCNMTPEDFLSEVGFWIVDFDTPRAVFENQAVLKQRVIEGQNHIFTFQHGDDFEEILKSAGATHIHRGSASLDQAVNAFLTQNHKKSTKRKTAKTTQKAA
jgi:ABC-2 type transport system ATP-binding protein